MFEPLLQSNYPFISVAIARLCSEIIARNHVNSRVIVALNETNSMKPLSEQVNARVHTENNISRVPQCHDHLSRANQSTAFVICTLRDPLITSHVKSIASLMFQFHRFVTSGASQPFLSLRSLRRDVPALRLLPSFLPAYIALSPSLASHYHRPSYSHTP